jgi:hypothetical protein
MSDVKKPNPENAAAKPVPFFARKVGRVPLTVRAGVRAGAREELLK